MKIKREFDIERLGDGLVAEAWADDSLVEAFRVKDSPGFTLAVQWHPEWKVPENAVSMKIFQAFGDACRAYRLRDLQAEVAVKAMPRATG